MQEIKIAMNLTNTRLDTFKTQLKDYISWSSSYHIVRQYLIYYEKYIYTLKLPA